MRLHVALFHRRGTTEETLKQFDQARHKYNDDWLRVSAVKLYIDDVIEPHTAALLEPYADRPETRGELDYPPEEFKQVVSRLDRRISRSSSIPSVTGESAQRWMRLSMRGNRTGHATDGMS